ncbi:MAG TPA: NAD(P)/FAD-dependent oxidoreductase [Nitrospirota bacterium]|nr:NAD(P)/FAD-dependent oxidoreductase [Nitrospirota bacterium]
MDSCDVLIIGGGPAGSTLAWKLRNRGLDVLILDKSAFPRDKVCAGWITPATTGLLQLNTDEYSRERVLQRISGFKTSMIGTTEVLTRYGRTVSYGIRRCEFDHYLLQRADARLRLGEPLKTMERKKSVWIINDDVKTPLVIGAGGHFCPVSRFLRGKGERNGSAVIAQEVEFEMDESQQRHCRVAGEIPELYFCDDLKGYGWCVRKGNFLNIGLGREGNMNVAEQVRSFFGYLRDKKTIPANTPSNFRGHAYMLYHGASPTLVDDGVMLIGDAAGLAYPKSGEGIRPAVESALTAADVILSAAGDYRRGRLLQYPMLLADRFGKGGTSPGILILPQVVRHFMSHTLMKSRWFSRHVLLDRWFLNAHRPA